MRLRRSSARVFLPLAALVLVGLLLVPRAVSRRTAAEGAPPTVQPADPRSSAPAGPAAADPSTPGAGAGFDTPPELAGHEREWPLANHDYANTRAAVGSTINAGNVANLKVAWPSPLK